LKLPKLEGWSGVGGLVMGAMLIGACAQILGVDDGLPFGDAGEAGREGDGGEAQDVRDATVDRTIDGPPGNADVRPEARSKDSGNGDERSADTSDDATCVPLPNFCVSRCGETFDNCGNPIECSACEGGLTCTAGGGCDCVPESTSITCGQQNCGTQINNCNQIVACGVKGTSDCEHSTDICEPEGGTCCTPPPASVTCGNQCAINVTDSCGQTVACVCGDGGVCQGASCCMPVATSLWCQGRCGTTTDNCGDAIDCGGCDGGLACGSSHTCGCVPNPIAETCGVQQCGYASDNCGELVGCGGGSGTCSGSSICEDGGVCCEIDASACGTSVCNTVIVACDGFPIPCPQTTCNGGEICLTELGQCCAPEPPSATCAGNACGTATNNCDASVNCTDTCDGGVCGGGDAGANTCCFDNGAACVGQCGGTAINNCGASIDCSDNCESSASCDSGSACCRPSGQACTLGSDCCSMSCNTDAGTCD
jgi:hypothetical protein